MSLRSENGTNFLISFFTPSIASNLSKWSGGISPFEQQLTCWAQQMAQGIFVKKTFLLLWGESAEISLKSTQGAITGIVFMVLTEMLQPFSTENAKKNKFMAIYRYFMFLIWFLKKYYFLTYFNLLCFWVLFDFSIGHSHGWRKHLLYNCMVQFGTSHQIICWDFVLEKNHHFHQELYGAYVQNVCVYCVHSNVFDVH